MDMRIGHDGLLSFSIVNIITQETINPLNMNELMYVK